MATRAETGEVLHTRLRGGSSQSGGAHFVAEAVHRARRAGAAGELTVRADSGFLGYDLLARLERLEVSWSITVPQNAKVKAAIADIPEGDREPITYPAGGEAHVAETTLTAAERGRGKGRETRIVVRRSRLCDAAQAEPWPDWRHHAFVTNRTDLTAVAADGYHRAHAGVELAIRDLKGSTGLAHNLYRWLARLAQTTRSGRLTVGRTIRYQLLALPGRLVNHAGRTILRLPARWPWAATFQITLTNIRALPQLC